MKKRDLSAILSSIIHEKKKPKQRRVSKKKLNSGIIVPSVVIKDENGDRTHLRIRNVIFVEKAKPGRKRSTIILWNDGSRTEVFCGDNETFDKEKGFAMALCKKLTANNNQKAYRKLFNQFIPNDFVAH